MKQNIIVVLLTILFIFTSWGFTYKNQDATKRNKEIMNIEQYIRQAKLTIERDDDSIPEIIIQLDKINHSFQDAASLGIMNAVKTQFLTLYLSQKSYQIEQQTDLDYIPKDMRVWSTNNFIDSIANTIKEGQAYNNDLKKLSSKQFKRLLQINELTPYYSASLYEYLTHQNLDILENIAFQYRKYKKKIEPLALSLLEELIKYEKSTNNTSAAIKAEIKKMNWMFGSENQSSASKNNTLDSLNIYYYKDKAPGIEWIIEKIKILQGHDTPIGYEESNEKNNPKAKTKEIFDLLETGLKKEPKHPLSNELRNTLSTITTPYIKIDNSTLIYPGDSIHFNISTRNIEMYTLKIYQFKVNPQGNTIPIFEPYNLEKEYPHKHLELVKSEVINFPQAPSWEEKGSKFSWKGTNEGLYFVIIENSKHKLKTSSLFNISTLNCSLRQINDTSTDIRIVDAKSGKPAKKAKITIYMMQKEDRTNLKKIDEVSTDEFGIALLPYYKDKNTSFTISHNKSIYIQPENFRTSKPSKIEEKITNRIQIFTDRSVYRPGQTVYFKGIITRPTEQYLETVKNQPVTIILKDTDYKKIAELKKTSNEFGSFDGSFSLPKEVLNGTFIIQCGTEYKYIHIEEYKRPNFFLSIVFKDDIITLGQSAKVEGTIKSFSQANLSKVNIEYTVKREEGHWRHQNSGSIITQGTTQSDEKGIFSFDFIPTPKTKGENGYFSVHIKATDRSGETQELYESIYISEKPYSLTSSIKKGRNNYPQITADSLRFNISATTQQGKTLNRKGAYRLYRMEEPSQSYSKILIENFTDKKLVREGKFSTKEQIKIQNPKQLASGFYCLEMETQEGFEKVLNSEYFILFHSDQSKAVNRQLLFYNLTQTKVKEGSDIDLFVSSGDKELYLLIENLTVEGIKSRKLIKLSNESKHINLNIPKQNSNTTQILLSFFKNKEYYHNTIQLSIEKPNRNLSIYPNTFRDLTQPGAEETWSFTIKDHDNQIVAADVLATMYDTSLDAIFPHNLYYNTGRYKQEPYIKINIYGLMRRYRNSQYKKNNYYNINLIPERFIFLKDFEFDGFGYYPTRSYTYKTKEAMPVNFNKARTLSKNEYDVDTNNITTEEVEGNGNKRLNNLQKHKIFIRENLNETAFFYPELRTDSLGSITFSFILPESNTRWKFNLLAHTSDFLTGLWQTKVVTQKKLMVMPNRPRFLRAGDTAFISTQVLNQSEKELKGSIHMELYDPETNTPILGKEYKQEFVINTKSSKSYTFEVKLPKNISFVGCRFIAKSEEGNDGEQAIIPILPANVNVTESLPFYLNKKQTKNLTFEIKSSVKPNTKIRKTIEVSTNPVNYVFAALPSVVENKSQDIISKLYRSYGYLLASDLIQKNPNLKQQIIFWDSQNKLSDNASPLSNNEDLKKLTINETPWLSVEQNERKRLANLIQLTDINKNQELAQKLIKEISKTQNDDGGWSWFPGSYSSFEITLSVVEVLNELNKHGYYTDNEKLTAMLPAAISRLDLFVSELNRLHLKNLLYASPSYMRYLILRNQFNEIPISKELAKINNNNLEILENKYKSFKFSDKILAGLTFAAYNKQEKVQELIDWLRKTSTIQEDRGMFWINNKTSYYYPSSPIYVHTQIIKLFRQNGGSEEELNALYQWLISEKRSQNWESIPATIDAAKALLDFTHKKENLKNTVFINWGNTRISDTEQDNMGYAKISEDDIKANYSPKTKIELKGQGPIWGAFYAQYEEPINSVQSHEAILKTEKEILLLSSKGNGNLAKKIHDGTVKVGDKILIRLTLKTDRDLMYVLLKDLFPACGSPVNQLSGYKFIRGINYYQEIETSSLNYFIEKLPRGTYIFEYELYIDRPGSYTFGYSEAQCLYAPEFRGGSESGKLKVLP